MLILGINGFHADSAACLLRDGEIVAAAEEERFRRIKHWAGFPHPCPPLVPRSRRRLGPRPRPRRGQPRPQGQPVAQGAVQRHRPAEPPSHPRPPHQRHPGAQPRRPARPGLRHRPRPAQGPLPQHRAPSGPPRQRLLRLAAGRPVVVFGHPAGALARFVRRHDCGLLWRPGEEDAVLGLLGRTRDPAFGARIRARFESEFDKPVALAHWSATLAGAPLPAPLLEPAEARVA